MEHNLTAFKHIQAAHCENGVTTSLLRNQGLSFMNEPLAFGMGSGLFYIYIPFLKINNGPCISFRTLPGAIFKRTCLSLGIAIRRKKYKNPKSAKKDLDHKIIEGIPVGCQIGVFQLTYFPVEYRFHFNAHNIIIYGKEKNNYLVSDPTMENVTTLTSEDLERVRFARGIFEPKGHIYHPLINGDISPALIKKGIIKGIKRNIRDMLHIPCNIIGIKGIKYTAKKVRTWRDKLGLRKAAHYLAQMVRMQEEIGTGGGGFRFVYAAFLQEASSYLSINQLINISEDFTRSGDLWRSSASQMAGVYKGRLTEQKDFDEIADLLTEIAETENHAFKKLSKLKLSE